MRTKTLFIYLILLSFVKITAQKWEVQNSGIKTTIGSVSFIDTMNGWATTYSENYLHTSDGGRNWIIEKINSENHGIRQIQFISNNIGYACGALGGLFSTKDGGKTWNTYTNNFEIDFWDLSFVDESEGWAVGERYGLNYSRGMIVHTSDGGASWEKQLEIESNNQFAARYFKSIRMKNAKEGWAIAGDYFDNLSRTYVYKTIDGGKNWNVLPAPILRPARRLKIAREDTLWVDGYGINPMSTTKDGGLNWEQSRPSEILINAISPQTGNTGWVSTADFIRGLPSNILYTTDRGFSWYNELSLNETINDIENKGNYVWIVGSNGLIMKRSPLSTSVKKDSAMLSSFVMYQNYPNPFNPTTTIRYQIPQDGHISLKVYDMLGREVAHLVNEVKRAGEYTVSFDGSKLSSGVYIYKLIGNNVNLSKKMILMK